MTPQTVLALVGPTASGKSKVALQIAEARRRAGAPPVEIVAVDAFTVYRGMDIGTATPTPDELERVPHHMVNALDPWDDVTVAWFQTEARKAIADVAGRGHTPLLVGGSGLYFRAVVDDLEFPPTDDDVRSRLESRWEDDPDAAHRQLAEQDPDAAERIEPNNLRRTVRALEVIELTGRPFSSFRTAWDDYQSIYPALDVALLRPPDEVLRRAIEGRAQRMVSDGLLDEAAALRSPGRPLSRTALQAIGYAEAFAALDGQLVHDELVTEISRRTWRYARRQLGWFTKDPRCVASGPGDVMERWNGQPR